MNDTTTRPAIEVAILGRGENLKTTTMQPRLAVAHEGVLMMDLVKMIAVTPAPIYTEQGGVFQRTEMLEPRAVVARAAGIVDEAIREMEARGWATELPALDELRGDVVAAGFMPGGDKS